MVFVSKRCLRSKHEVWDAGKSAGDFADCLRVSGNLVNVGQAGILFPIRWQSLGDLQRLMISTTMFQMVTFPKFQVSLCIPKVGQQLRWDGGPTRRNTSLWRREEHLSLQLEDWVELGDIVERGMWLLLITWWLWLFQFARGGQTTLECLEFCSNLGLRVWQQSWLCALVGCLQSGTFQMGPPGGKSVRVLSAMKVLSQHQGPKTCRSPKVVQKQSLKPSSRIVRAASSTSMPTPMKSRRSIGSSRPVVKEPPKPRRGVRRIPAAQEDNIGKRARMKQLTVLESRSVSVEVQSQYQLYYDKFKAFCQENGTPMPLSTEEADELMADYLDCLFLQGKTAGEGEKSLASLEFHDLSFKGKMPRSKRALRGWRKEVPPQSRLPLPKLAMYGIVMQMLAGTRGPWGWWPLPASTFIFVRGKPSTWESVTLFHRWWQEAGGFSTTHWQSTAATWYGWVKSYL